MQRIDALKSIGRNIRDVIIDSTPASLSASHMDFLSLVHPISNQLQGREAYIYNGAAAGQARIVTSFAPANNRLNFEQVWASLPSTNSQVLLFNYFQKADLDNAFDRIFGQAQMKYLEEKVATLLLVGTQYEYVVPSGFEYIHNLRLVPSSSNSGYSDYEVDSYVRNIHELAPHLWTIVPNPLGSWVLAFDARKINLDSFDSQTVRIEGQAKPAAIGSDNTTIPIDLEEYLINGASMILSSQRITESQEWRDKFRMFRDLTSDLESYVFKHRRGKRVG